MVFCSSRSWGWVSISKVSVIWNRRPSSRATEISCSGLPRIGSPMARAACMKAGRDLCAGT
jgi:hypothetical protein